MNTSPCVCQGSNENCRYCAGRGYVEAGKGLPASIGQQKLSISGGWGRGRAKPTLPCPICGCLVIKLQRHLNRKHGGAHHGSPLSSAETQLAISSTSGNRHPSPQPVERPVLPINANIGPASVRHLTTELKPTCSGGVRCPRCLALFDGRETLRIHLHGNCSEASLKIERRAALIRCPGCGSSVKQSRLQKHLVSKCPSRLVSKAEKDTSATAATRTLSGHARNPVAKKPSSGATWAEVNSRDKLDHTKNYAHPYRESGKYGSHSMHDGFDDESGPD
ncbi:MAG: hypothetical protein JWO71_2325 [Candidatus Acidoferrum typicum]|nr:hypothetical protein [Candidatus Acidoferrum typicum]